MTTKTLLLGPDGKSARAEKPAHCPRCGKGPEFRVLSSGFGEPHDCCRNCGHDFDERTLP